MFDGNKHIEFTHQLVCRMIRVNIIHFMLVSEVMGGFGTIIGCL